MSQIYGTTNCMPIQTNKYSINFNLPRMKNNLPYLSLGSNNKNKAVTYKNIFILC